MTLYRSGKLTVGEYRQRLMDLYVQTPDAKVMRAVRKAFVRMVAVS